MLKWFSSIQSEEKPSAGSKVGYYGIVKRNLDDSRPESLSIPFDLPVEWDKINQYANEMDKLELDNNPDSSYRYFPTRLTADEVDEHLRRKALFAHEVNASKTPN